MSIYGQFGHFDPPKQTTPEHEHCWHNFNPSRRPGTSSRATDTRKCCICGAITTVAALRSAKESK